jgi:hypothetical protein
MACWIKCHDALMKGAKRGLPRAVRFILLELSLLSRDRSGVMTLPVGMSDLDAVHDCLGGNRAEVEDALARLTAGDDPTIVIRDAAGGERELVIPKWGEWNEPTSTARVRAHRETQPHETKRKRSGNGVKRKRNGGATAGNAPRGEERERREEEIPTGDAVAALPAEAPRAATTPAAPAGAPKPRPASDLDRALGKLLLEHPFAGKLAWDPAEVVRTIAFAADARPVELVVAAVRKALDESACAAHDPAQALRLARSYAERASERDLKPAKTAVGGRALSRPNRKPVQPHEGGVYRVPDLPPPVDPAEFGYPAAEPKPPSNDPKEPAA